MSPQSNACIKCQCFNIHSNKLQKLAVVLQINVLLIIVFKKKIKEEGFKHFLWLYMLNYKKK